MKKALILDLDNTIYPADSIADEVFGPVYELIENDPVLDEETTESAKHDLLHRPFQHLADEHGFSEELKNKGIEYLKNYSYEGSMQPFDDYHHLREIKFDKFLVTTGFTKFQSSKVKQLGVESDFKAIHIVDPELTSKSKKDIFQQILDEYGYTKADILVIGDDPDSEIKAAQDLGIDTFLYDPENKHPDAASTYRGKNMHQVVTLL